MICKSDRTVRDEEGKKGKIGEFHGGRGCYDVGD
jgi:hypothetical protein